MVNLTKIIALFAIIIISSSKVFAVGSIGIDGHILKVNFSQEDFTVLEVKIKDQNNELLFFEEGGCHSSICSYDGLPELPSVVLVFVKTNYGWLEFTIYVKE